MVEGRKILTAQAKKVLTSMKAADIAELMDSGQIAAAGDNQNQNQHRGEAELAHPEVIEAFKQIPQGKLKDTLVKHGIIQK